MGENTGIEWTDSTWSPIRHRARKDAAAIARAKGYTSLIQIAEKMAGRVGQHCEHVSPGCESCYAETNNHRCLPANGTGLPYDRRSRDLVEPFIDEKALLLPLKWGPVQVHSEPCELAWETLRGLRERRPKCGCPTRRRRIFVENQSDLFGEWVPDELLDRVFAVMALCPQRTFQVLTKRPERMKKYFEDETERAYAVGAAAGCMLDGDWIWKKGKRFRSAIEHIVSLSLELEMDGETQASESLLPLPNVWLGVSVENQAAADERIPLLLQTPATVRFLSCEPLLGPLNLNRIEVTDGEVDRSDPEWPTVDGCCIDALNGTAFDDENGELCTAPDGEVPIERGIDWVICGGESGPGARPMHPDWARSLRDQCQAAGVPYFFKQWGEWVPCAQAADAAAPACSVGPKRVAWLNADGKFAPVCDAPMGLELGPGNLVLRIGKHAAGALLDGREWKQFPEVSR